jgi:hypothetical protein
MRFSIRPNVINASSIRSRPGSLGGMGDGNREPGELLMDGRASLYVSLVAESSDSTDKGFYESEFAHPFRGRLDQK